MNTHTYDREGNPITLEQFSALSGDHTYRVVGQEEVHSFVVSTVWLGIDHSFGGPPVIFETMVFDHRDAPQELSSHARSELDELEQRRYTTTAQALAGHAETVERIKDLVEQIQNVK